MPFKPNTLLRGKPKRTYTRPCDMSNTEYLLVTGHGLVWHVVRVESSLEQVVSVSIEGVDMASIESPFAVHHREQRSEEIGPHHQVTQLGPHCVFSTASLETLERLIPES